MIRSLSSLAAVLLMSGIPSVTAPPRTLAADPFYAKYVDADGIPILSSARAPDRALLTAQAIVRGMLAHRPDLARTLVAWHFRVAVMAPDEGTTDLPEQRDWKKPTRDDPRLTYCERKHYEERIGRLTDRDYWNARARGMAGQLTSGAAEDLLGERSSRYYGETIFLHEFSHDVLDAIQAVDPALHAEVERAYADALKAGRWKREYASTTVQEYWAEGSQFWFNSNRIAIFDGRRILSDEDLKAYDPALYASLAKAYGPTHHIDADPFYLSDARVPPGPLPANTAEVC
uniref:glycoside hydrolase n=1 Tax=Sphingomonas bacterium TaxID=1895847 RepID=UPI0026289255|nr:glycoside hydrolase [Sphingomonas bacterium]